MSTISANPEAPAEPVSLAEQSYRDLRDRPIMLDISPGEPINPAVSWGDGRSLIPRFGAGLAVLLFAGTLIGGRVAGPRRRVPRPEQWVHPRVVCR